MVTASNFGNQEQAIVCIHTVPLLRYKLGKSTQFFQQNYV